MLKAQKVFKLSVFLTPQTESEHHQIQSMYLRNKGALKTITHIPKMKERTTLKDASSSKSQEFVCYNKGELHRKLF